MSVYFFSMNLLLIKYFSLITTYLLSLFFIYLFYLFNFFDFASLPFLGKGFIHKTAIILFDRQFLQEIFTYFSFFGSWIVVLIFLNRNLKNILILLYFLVLSLILWPIEQEYFDPLILILVFTFFSTKIYVNYKNSIILYLYLSILLISANVYYYNLLN